MRDLLFRVDHVISTEIDVVRHQLMRNGVDILTATRHVPRPAPAPARAGARRSSPGDQRRPDRHRRRHDHGDRIRSRCGTASTSSPATICSTWRSCRSRSVVVGAGVIGLEYACIFAALGVRVTLVDSSTQLLPFVDREIIEALVYHLRDNRATLHLGETVSSIDTFQDERGEHVRMHLNSGKQVLIDKVLYSVGRRGATDNLGLEAAGLHGRRARTAAGQRAVSDRRAPHLRGRRRHRLSQPGFDVDGTGPARRLPRLRSADEQRARAVSLRHLHRS